MSNFDPSKNKKFNQIIFDYPRVALSKGEVSEPSDSDNKSAFTVPYPNQSSEKNLFYIEDGSESNYSHTKIYINQLIHHNIQNITTNNKNIIGEMVIEHTSSTGKIIYTCYLLETPSIRVEDENEIDKILSMSTKDNSQLEVELNSIIPYQDGAIIYESKGNVVCVFTTPIQVNTASSTKIVERYPAVTNLFDTYNSVYSVIPGNNISKRDADDIYIDCAPTGVSEDEIKSYTLPINSKMASQSEQSDYMKTTVNYGLFIFAMLLSYIIVPLLYKNLIIDGSAIAFPLTTEVKPRFTRIRTADILTGLVMLVLMLSFFGVGGSSESDYKLISVGIFIFVFSILSFGLIQLKKTTDVEFMTTKIGTQIVVSDPTSVAANEINPIPFDDFGKTLAVIWGVMFSSDSLSAYFAFLIVSIIILSIMYFVGSLTVVSFGNLSGIFTGVFVLISMIMGIKKIVEHKRGAGKVAPS